MSMTSDVRPPDHQGAESGRFLQTIEGYLQGENGFYEAVFGSSAPRSARRSRRRRRSSARRGPGSGSRITAAAARPRATTSSSCRRWQAATALVKAYRTHGHLAANLDPLGTEPSGDPALDPDTAPDAGAHAPDPVEHPGIYVDGANLEEALPHLRERSTQARSPTRSSTSRATASACGCARADRGRRVPDAAGAEDARRVLRRLIAVDGLERFLHKATSARSSSRSRAST